jgi:hypothetical protein
LLGITFEDGQSDSEVRFAETRFGLRFPPGLRAFLQDARPSGNGFSDCGPVATACDGLRTALISRQAGGQAGAIEANVEDVGKALRAVLRLMALESESQLALFPEPKECVTLPDYRKAVLAPQCV